MNSAIGPYKGGLRFHPRLPGRAQVPRLRAGLQERSDDAAYRRGQRRLGLRPEAPQLGRSEALLPIVHDRAVPAHRSVHRRARRGHRRGRQGDRLPFRPVQAHHQPIFWRTYRQRPGVGRVGYPARGDRVRAVYFAQEMLATRSDSLEGKTCLVSGSGNVAQFTAEKLIDVGARPVTLSDSGGFVHDPDGIDREKLDWVMELKNVRRGRIRQYAEQFPGSGSYRPPRATPTRCGASPPTAPSQARRRTR